MMFQMALFMVTAMMATGICLVLSGVFAARLFAPLLSAYHASDDDMLADRLEDVPEPEPMFPMPAFTRPMPAGAVRCGAQPISHN